MLDFKRSAAAPDRVVIMGSGGFVGGAVAARLNEFDVEVTALSRAEVDLLSEGAAIRLADYLGGAESLVVTSAIAPCRSTEEMLLNVRMMREICRALEHVAVPQVIYVSSDAVYADGPVPLTEETCAAPTSLHGAMHVAREMMLRSTCAEDALCILRPSLLYGANDPHNGYGPNRFRRLAANGEDIVLFGEGEERRDHVLIDDVAEIVHLCLTHRASGVLNVATGSVTSFHDVAQLVASYFDPLPAIRTTKREGPMPHGGYRPFDIESCRTAFPDFRYTPIDDGIAKVHRATRDDVTKENA